MSDCCNNKSCEITALQQNQTSTLKIVLLINALMFIVELSAGMLANSNALLADSLDMLGDALVYGFSLYVVGLGIKWKARSALLKGSIMLLFGMFVLAHTIYKIIYPQLPTYELMSLVGLLALLANGICLGLLWRHRSDDINMRSVWLCSRNDIIANTAVLLAAAAVWLLQSAWPDIVVGLGIGYLFLRSSIHVLRDARATMANTA
jgi:cation diffusion facilitator family transporter